MRRFNFLNNLTIPQLFLTIVFAVIILIMVLFGLVYRVRSLQEAHNLMLDNKHKSYLLIDELRHSTDDMTRFARTFAVTGNSRYEDYYADVHSIFIGERLRPVEYYRVYWDLMAWNGKKPRVDEKVTVSFKKLLEQAGFTKEEFAKFKEIEQNFSAVTDIERGALDILKNTNTAVANDPYASLIAQPDSSQFGTGTANQSGGNNQTAISMLHDENYHNVKAKLMQSIDELYQMVNDRIETDTQLLDNKIVYYVNSLYTFFAIIILLNIFTIIILKQKVSNPINKLREYLIHLSRGFIPKQKIIMPEKNEIAEMAGALNTYLDGITQTAKFANRIGNGELNATFTPLSNEDELGNSLLEMQSSLLKTAEDDKRRKIEEEHRNWSTHGLATFGDILRQNAKDISELSYNVVSNLINYLKANQGGIFLFNDDDKEDIHLELVAAYAYDRRKYMQKHIALKEGLIGTCAVEKKTVFLTKLPPNYIEITSGLGESEPRCLLIVPLIREEELLGVMEIASFSLIADFEIDFVDKLAENIASTLASTKINQRTSDLLRQSQQQAEALSSQEEEMRQNMEELQATQEEAARKEAEARSFVNAVNHTAIRADFSVDGFLTYANSKFLEIMGYMSSEADGKHVTFFFQEEDRETFQHSWESLVSGGKHFEHEVKHKTKTGYIWLLSTFTAVRDIDGNVKEFLYLGNDISESKKQESEVNRLLEETQQKTKLLIEQENRMKQNLVELQRAKEELELQQKNLQLANEKMKANEVVLQKSFQKTKENEYKLQEKSAELALNEQELRQNLEELKATQEAIATKESELRTVLTAISMNTLVAEYDMNGQIIDMNEQFCNLFKTKKREMLGRNHSELGTYAKNVDEYRKFWKDLAKGITRKEITHIQNEDSEFWLSESYNPVIDVNGNVRKILNIALDITKMKLMEEELVRDKRELQSNEEELQQNLEMLVNIQHETEEKQTLMETEKKSLMQKIEELTEVKNRLQELLKERENEISKLKS